MNKNNRGFCKEYKMTPREYRELRHLGEMYCKAIKRDIDRDKSRHDCLYTTPCEQDRKEHPSWYLNGRTITYSNEEIKDKMQRDCGSCRYNKDGFCTYFGEAIEDAYLADCSCKVEAST